MCLDQLSSQPPTAACFHHSNKNFNNKNFNPPDGFVGIRWVLERTSLSRSTLYREIARGQFPKPHKLSAARVGWLRSEVEAWMARAAGGRA